LRTYAQAMPHLSPKTVSQKEIGLLRLVIL